MEQDMAVVTELLNEVVIEENRELKRKLRRIEWYVDNAEGWTDLLDISETLDSIRDIVKGVV